MTHNITDAQLAFLRTGAARADLCLVVLTGKRAGIKKSAEKMIEAGWLKEMKAKPDAPVWRTDGETGAPYALKLTAAGLKVVRANETPDAAVTAIPMAPGGADVDEGKESPAPRLEPQIATRPTFREGSKLSEVMKLLRRDGGVTIEELAATMGWLPHTTRAVLTGLRKRGISVERHKTPDSRVSAYAIGKADGSVGMHG
jgi:hypothetical protein